MDTEGTGWDPHSGVWKEQQVGARGPPGSGWGQPAHVKPWGKCRGRGMNTRGGRMHQSDRWDETMSTAAAGAPCTGDWAPVWLRGPRRLRASWQTRAAEMPACSEAAHSSPAQSTSISKETHTHRASISRRSSNKQPQFLQMAVKMGREPMS